MLRIFFFFPLELDICKSPSSISTYHHRALINEHHQFTTSDGTGGSKYNGGWSFTTSVELVGQNTTEDGVGDIILECRHIRYAMVVDRIEYPIV